MASRTDPAAAAGQLVGYRMGPPIVAPDDVFVDMMKSAVQLCKSLNYRSAGTIEYLYQPDTKKYYFLELNPRLQVEH